MAEVKKILIVRFSSIGDIVLTTPVIRTLNKRFPEARIHYLTKVQYAPILETNPYISKVHVLSDDWGDMIAELKKEKFDVLVDLHFNLRTRLLKWSLNVSSYSFDKINIRKWIMVNLKINVLPDRHIVDRYLDTVKPLGVENDGLGLDYFIPHADDVNPAEFLPLKDLPFTVFAIGGQHYTKKYPVEMIREMALKHKGFLVLIGGKEDTDAGDAIATDLNNVINLCGRLSINQSASVIAQARAVITHDTGMMHIAAAFKKRIVSLWGNTIPEFGMSPYMADPASSILEVRDLSCRPCSKIGFEQCPKGHFKCMRLIDPDAVAEAVNP